jgi:hypothetical protein
MGFLLEEPGEIQLYFLLTSWTLTFAFLWTGWWRYSLLSGAMIQVVWLNWDVNLFAGWGFILPGLLISLFFSTSESKRLQIVGRSLLIFHLLSIYMVPSLDRLVGRDWFNGRILAVLFASDLSRWKFEINYQSHWIWACFSTLAWATEAFLPPAALLIQRFRGGRFFMAAFHAIITILTDFPVWNQMMTFMWLGLPDISLEPKHSRRLIPVSMLIILFCTMIIPRDFRFKRSYALLKTGLFGFSQMKMFSIDQIPVLRSSRMKLCWDEKCSELNEDQQYYVWQVPTTSEAMKRFCIPGVREVRLEWDWSSSDPVFENIIREKASCIN